MSDRALKIFLLFSILGVLMILTVQVSYLAHDVHTIASPSTSTQSDFSRVDIVPYPDDWSSLPECAQEDSWTTTDCKWDAGSVGNGVGHSFYSKGGQIYYVS